jgi:hypothetical protein
MDMIKLCTPLPADAIRAICANTIPDGPATDFAIAAATDFAIAAARDIGTIAPDGTVFAGILPSGELLYAMPRDEGDNIDFDAAQRFLKISNVETYYGHDDWRLPSLPELRMMFNHRAEIGGFSAEDGSHWFRTSDFWADKATYISFRDGDEDEFSKDGYFCLRYVRTEKNPALAPT